MSLLAQVIGTIEEYGLLVRGEPVVVGVSGGPDSLCLLHVLRCLAPEYGITPHVAHMEHGIRGEESEADARFVSHLTQSWGLPIAIEHADVPRLAEEEGLAIEEAARRARYGFLARVAIEVGASRIAVGHNGDDQVETVLMHLLRGSGLAGLRGMLPLSPLGELRLGDALRDNPMAAELRLIRPLLEIPRSAIEAYCGSHGLEPRFDRSNLDTTYYRNRLRHELLPILETYNPNIREVLSRTAQVVSADYELLRRDLEKAWDRILCAELEGQVLSGRAIQFDLASWRALPLSLRRSTLREAIHRLRRSLRNINWVHVENARRVAERGETGAQATLPRHLMLTVGYKRLTVAEGGYVPAVECPTVEAPLPVAVPGTTHLPGTEWQLVAQIVDRAHLSDAVLHSGERWQAFLEGDATGRDLILRPRRSEDRFQPLGMGGHSQRVRDFMINVKVPAAHRDRVPLLVSGDHILWVCGWREDERMKVTESTQRVLWLRFVRGLEQGT